MPWVSLDRREPIRAFCRRDPLRYAFHLGDLDDSEWDKTEWHACPGADDPAELLLIYRGLALPCVHAFGSRGPLGSLLIEALPVFPDRSYLHVDQADLPGLETHLRVRRDGIFLRMAWEGFPADPAGLGAGRAERLTKADLPALLSLLAAAYPGSHFEATQLGKGVFYGVREANGLLACAGLHAYSEREGMAVLGNIATLPARRGEGLARAVTAALLVELREKLRWVTLNVQRENEPARRVYRRLGFRDCFEYVEAYCEAASRDR